MQTFGPCLVAILRERGYLVTLVESYGGISDGFLNLTHIHFDLVIATNTCLPPAHIRGVVPDIRARHPHARIIVLSGYYPEDFVADLNREGIDGFLPLPFVADALLKEVAGQLSRPVV